MRSINLVKIFLLTFSAFFLCGCGEVIRTEANGRSSKQFVDLLQAGWFPAELTVDFYSLTSVHDLDTSLALGVFYLVHNDLSEFRNQLIPFSNIPTAPNRRIRKKNKEFEEHFSTQSSRVVESFKLVDHEAEWIILLIDSEVVLYWNRETCTGQT